MDSSSRSSVGNPQGGQTSAPGSVSAAPQGQQSAQPPQPQTTPRGSYDPIFSPTAMAGANTGIYNSKSAPVVSTNTAAPTKPIISSGSTAPPAAPATPKKHGRRKEPTPPPLPGMGDIVLAPSSDASSEQKNNKLPLVIAGAVIALVLIVGVAVVALSGRSTGGGDATSETTETTASFNRLVNYLYSGEESDEYSEAAYSDDAEYQLETMLTEKDQEVRANYFDVAQGLLGDVKDIPKYNDLLQDLSEKLTLLASMSAIIPLQYNDIQNYYLSHTSAATRIYINSYYSALTSDSASGELQQYAQNYIDYNLSVVTRLDTGVRVGCIRQSEADIECMESETLTNALPADFNSYSTEKYSSDDLRMGTVSGIIQDLAKIHESLNSQSSDTEEVNA